MPNSTNLVSVLSLCVYGVIIRFISIQLPYLMAFPSALEIYYSFALYYFTLSPVRNIYFRKARSTFGNSDTEFTRRENKFRFGGCGWRSRWAHSVPSYFSCNSGEVWCYEGKGSFGKRQERGRNRRNQTFGEEACNRKASFREGALPS